MALSKKHIGYCTIFSFILLFITTFFYIYTTQVGRFQIISVYSENVGNLKLENSVKVKGVHVGFVKKIKRKNNKAYIELKIDKDIIIKEDYTLKNVDVGLMGDREIILDPGLSKRLTEDNVLYMEFVPGIAEGISNASGLKNVITNLFNIVNSLSEKDLNNSQLFRTKFYNITKKLDSVSFKLDNVFSENQNKINSIIDKSTDLSKNVKNKAIGSQELLNTKLDQFEKLSIKIMNIIAKLELMIDKSYVFVDKTSKKENFVGKVLLDSKTYGQIIEIVRSLKKIIKITNQEGIQNVDIDLF